MCFSQSTLGSYHIRKESEAQCHLELSFLPTPARTGQRLTGHKYLFLPSSSLFDKPSLDRRFGVQHVKANAPSSPLYSEEYWPVAVLRADAGGSSGVQQPKPWDQLQQLRGSVQIIGGIPASSLRTVKSAVRWEGRHGRYCAPIRSEPRARPSRMPLHLTYRRRETQSAAPTCHTGDLPCWSGAESSKGSSFAFFGV